MITGHKFFDHDIEQVLVTDTTVELDLKNDQSAVLINREDAKALAIHFGVGLSVQSEDELRVLVELLCHTKGAPGFDARIARLRDEAVAMWKARK